MRRIALLLILILTVLDASAQPAAPELMLTLGRGEIVSAAWSPDGESVWISTTAGTWQLDTDLHEIAANPHITYAALSPDGTKLAGISVDGFVGLWNAASGAELWRYGSATQAALLPVWSPDSQRFAFGQKRLSSTLFIFNIESQQLESPIYEIARFLTWSPSGRYLAGYVPDTERIFFYERDGRVQFLEGRFLDYGSTTLLWLGEDELHWSSSGDGGVAYRWSVPDGKLLEKNAPCNATYYGCSYSPDMRRAAALRIVDYRLLDLATNEGISLSVGSTIYSPVWSSDSDRLTFTLNEGRIPASEPQGLLTINPSTGSVLWKQDALGYTPSKVTWRPDDIHILAAGPGGIALLDSTTGEIVSRNVKYRAYDQLTFDTGETSVAVSDTQGDIRVVNFEGRILAELPGTSFPVAQLEWQPGKNVLAVRDERPTWQRGSVRLWTLDEPVTSETLISPNIDKESRAGAVDIAWNDDGTLLAVALMNIVKLFGDREEELEIPLPNYNALSPPTIMEIGWINSDEPVVVFYQCCHGPLHIANIISGDLGAVWNGAWSVSLDSLIVTTQQGYYQSGEHVLPALFVNPSAFTTEVPRIEMQGADDRYSSYHWISPLGTFAAAIDGDGGGMIWDTGDGRPLHFLADVANLVWSPDDSVLGIVRRDGAVWLLSHEDSDLSLLWQPTVPVKTPGTLVWSGNGRSLAYVVDGVARVWRR